MNWEDFSLLEQLQHYAQEDRTAFHMPGHKRNTTLAPYLSSLCAALDITEIPPFDTLCDPQTTIRQAMETAAKLWGSDHTFFSVNGSTGGLLSGIRAATRWGDHVLVSRNCHKAVYHALELCGLHPIFLVPPTVANYGCCASIPPAAVEQALQVHPEIRLVILTSPTFEGVLSDVATICRIAHAHNIPVLVDEAHGVHLGLSPAFPTGAVTAGADIVVQSLHKTLPSLTQTALLHVSGPLIPVRDMRRQMDIFQSSSPSYLLLASMESCIRLLDQQGTALLAQWRQRLDAFDETLSDYPIHILGHGCEKGQIDPQIFDLDPSKLVISTRGTALSGLQLMEQLRTVYQIELEMGMEEYATAMTGMGDTQTAMEKLADALCTLSPQLIPSHTDSHTPPLPLPSRSCSLLQAAQSPWELVPLQEAVGRVSAESLWVYPPGIPFLTPGEVVDHALLPLLASHAAHGLHLMGTRGNPPITLAVLPGERP